MTRKNQMFRIAAVGLVLLAGAAWSGNSGVAAAQQTMPGTNRDPIMPPSQPPGALPSEDPSVSGRMGADRLEAMKMADRRNHAQKDIEKMSALTTELKSDFEKTHQGELPADLLRKAKEIEKLAHDLQSQMAH
ncbi:MAG TPA: hypothetical protein VFA99_14780 [Acidobacteriaceae bacterium]|nr:hypothetical protein [Acidobacteriaceae bacterium]